MDEPMEQPAEESMDDGAKIAMLLAAVPEEEQAPEEAPPEEAPPEEPTAEDEDAEAAMPNAETMADLFSAVYGDVFNPESEDAVSKMANLEGMLSERPEVAAAIAKGDMGVAEAALMMFRQINV